jgi:hypothetical protein
VRDKEDYVAVIIREQEKVTVNGKDVSQLK